MVDTSETAQAPEAKRPAEPEEGKKLPGVPGHLQAAVQQLVCTSQSKTAAEPPTPSKSQ